MTRLYCAYTDILPDNYPYDFIELLSAQAKSKLLSLKRDEDRNLLLISSILLLKALNENCYNSFKLNTLQYDKNGKPFLKDSPFDFNISHTDDCAAVVFSTDCRVGIDIEKIKEIDFSDFTNYFSNGLWDDINSSTDKLKKFYYYWTLIESGVKADGRGLSLISEKKIELVDGNLFIDNVQWFYNHYDFDRLISCSITTDKKSNQIEIKKVTSI